MMSEPAEEQEALVLRDHIVVQADGSSDPNYKVLVFLSDLGPGAVHGIPIILIAQVESKFLVAIPFNSWNRLVRLRSEMRVGNQWSSGCFEGESHCRGESSSDFVAGSDRSAGSGSWPSNPIIGRFSRRCTPIFFVLETCSSGHIREPAHQIVASYMGRSVHVEDQGAGRFCGKASEAWEEESMGEARWKTRGSSDHLAKGRSKEKAEQRRRKRREEPRFNRGGSGGSSLLFKPLMQDSDSDLEPEFNPQLQSGSGQKAEFDAEAPPGSRATTVHPGAWWAASFRFCMQLGSSFGQFLKSFHKKPSSSSNGRGTVTFWPMPLPYPRVFKQCISTKDFDLKKTQFQKGVNLTIACLKLAPPPAATTLP